MSEELQFRCQACGEEIAADPSTMVEVQWGPELMPSEQAEAMQEEGSALTEEQLREMGEEDLREIGLTPETRDAIVSGKPAMSALCICHRCQDEALARMEDSGDTPS